MRRNFRLILLVGPAALVLQQPGYSSPTELLGMSTEAKTDEEELPPHLISRPGLLGTAQPGYPTAAELLGMKKEAKGS